MLELGIQDRLKPCCPRGIVGSIPTVATMSSMILKVSDEDMKILKAVQEQSYPDKDIEELLSGAIYLLGWINFLHQNHSQTLTNPLYGKIDDLQ